jgi:glycosyltransferase involved in cell wall biosynthesis
MTVSRGRQRLDAEITMTEASARERQPEHMTDPYESSPIDLTIFVSCYNESDYIVNTLDTVCAAANEAGHSFEVIVIDDRSKDNSRDLVRTYIAEHPEQRIILRANKTNQGLAQNYIDGAFLGRGKYYRLLCGDHSELKESTVKVLNAIGQADIILPYYTSSEGKGLRREAISKTYTAIINLITGYRLHYYNGLAVHLRYNVMRWHPNTRGFGFQAELLCLLLDLGFTVQEVPMIVVERRVGRSNALTLRNVISVSHTIFELFARRLSRYIYGDYRRIGADISSGEGK